MIILDETIENQVFAINKKNKKNKVPVKTRMICKRYIMNTFIKECWKCEICVEKLDFKTKDTARDKVRKFMTTKGLILYDITILHILYMHLIIDLEVCEAKSEN